MELNGNTTIIIKTVDGKNIPFIKDIIIKSSTIKKMLDTNNNNFIHLKHDKCTYKNMMKVKEFLSYIYSNPDEIPSILEYRKSFFTSPLSSFIQTYMNSIANDISELSTDLTKVSEYLDINELHELAICAMFKLMKKLLPPSIACMAPY